MLQANSFTKVSSNQSIVQNLLAENGQLCEKIAGFQRIGKFDDVSQYMDLLHKNLLYLAKLGGDADLLNQLQQDHSLNYQSQQMAMQHQQQQQRLLATQSQTRLAPSLMPGSNIQAFVPSVVISPQQSQQQNAIVLSNGTPTPLPYADQIPQMPVSAGISLQSTPIHSNQLPTHHFMPPAQISTPLSQMPSLSQPQLSIGVHTQTSADGLQQH